MQTGGLYGLHRFREKAFFLRKKKGSKVFAEKKNVNQTKICSEEMNVSQKFAMKRSKNGELKMEGS